MAYPESTEFYKQPDIGVAHLTTLFNRVNNFRTQYFDVWEVVRGDVDELSFGGPTFAECVDRFEEAFPGYTEELVDDLWLSDTAGQRYGLVLLPFTTPAEYALMPAQNQLCALASAWMLHRMLLIALVLQLKRWHTFGEHGGRPIGS